MDEQLRSSIHPLTPEQPDSAHDRGLAQAHLAVQLLRARILTMIVMLAFLASLCWLAAHVPLWRWVFEWLFGPLMRPGARGGP